MSRSKLLPKSASSTSPVKKTKSQKPVQPAKAKSKRNPKKTKMNDRDLLESLNEDTAVRNSKLAKKPATASKPNAKALELSMEEAKL